MMLVGDCHGKYLEYYNLVKNEQETIQLGDFGFNYDIFKKLDRNKHKLVGGNHEDWSKIRECPNFLGRFGYYKPLNTFLDLFYISGASSIDEWSRVPGLCWFRDEELNYSEAQECLDKYELFSPVDIVLSHDCPQFLANGLWGYEASFTRKLLDEIFQIQKPKLWIFGHHHKHIDMEIEGCRFVCLNELETMVI